MAKTIIENAITSTIPSMDIEKRILGLVHGIRKDEYTDVISSGITNSDVRVSTQYISGLANRVIDLIKYKSSKISPLVKNDNNEIDSSIVDWALEVKHYTPHQSSYKSYSVGDCVKDVLKLADCGFQKYYILQIQTYITQFSLKACKYADFVKKYPIFEYLHKTDEAKAQKNISKITPFKRMHMEMNSRNILDRNLIKGEIVIPTIKSSIADIDVKVIYLISGPFNYRAVKTNTSIDITKEMKSQIGSVNKGLSPYDCANIGICSSPLA